MKELIKKIAAAKSEIGKISKDSTNPFYKSKYFDINTLLDQVEPMLQKHGLIVLQPIIDNKVNTCIYDVDTGNSIESSIELPDIKDPQKLGSAITYYRRYTLQSLLSLQAEDDDGNNAKPKKILDVLPESKYNDAIKSLKNGTTIDQIRKKYTISKELETNLINNANETV